MFRLLLFFEDSYQYLQDKVAHESSWWWLLHNFSQCFLSSFYSLTGYTIIMPSPSLPIQRELALIQKNILYVSIHSNFEQWSYQAVYHPTKYINVIFYLIILTHPQDINPKVVWVGFLPRFGAQCEQLRAFGVPTPVNCTKFRPRMGIGVGFMETAKIPKDGLPNHGQTLWMQFCTMCTYMQIKCIVWTRILHCVEDMGWKLWALH